MLAADRSRAGTLPRGQLVTECSNLRAVSTMPVHQPMLMHPARHQKHMESSSQTAPWRHRTYYKPFHNWLNVRTQLSVDTHACCLPLLGLCSIALDGDKARSDKHHAHAPTQGPAQALTSPTPSRPPLAPLPHVHVCCCRCPCSADDRKPGSSLHLAPKLSPQMLLTEMPIFPRTCVLLPLLWVFLCREHSPDPSTPTQPLPYVSISELLSRHHPYLRAAAAAVGVSVTLYHMPPAITPTTAVPPIPCVNRYRHNPLPPTQNHNPVVPYPKPLPHSCAAAGAVVC
jgi:hypothetical protein